MTDQFETRLAERLQALPLPESTPDLASRSIRRAEQLRRRRSGCVVLAVIMLLAIPAVASAWMEASKTESPPAVSPTKPAPASGPTYLILDVLQRSPGPAPQLTTVQGDSVRFADGHDEPLPSTRVGTIAEYGTSVAWLTRMGSQFSLNLAPGPLSISGHVSGVDPGPSGSVMVRSTSGPFLWTRSGTLVQPSQPALRTRDMVATTNALWVDHAGGVIRMDASDPALTTLDANILSEWTGVVLGDVRSDRVVVTDKHDCQVLLDGTSGAVVWRTCDHTILALSPDGRLAATISLRYRTVDVVAVPTGDVRVRIDTDPAGDVSEVPESLVSSLMVFDEQDRLTVLAGNAQAGARLATVDENGSVWISAGPASTPDLVLPNRH